MARADYRKSNDHFNFHNENPKGCLTAQDCALRALGYCNDGWDNVYKELSEIGFEIKNTFNSNKCVEEYLKRHGWDKQKQPRKSDGRKIKLQDFARAHKDDGKIFVGIANHWTCVDGGYIIDTWDCGEKCVGNYWTKGNVPKRQYRERVRL